MQQTIFVKPTPGILIRDPVSGQHLAEAGEEKPRNSFWLRRIKDGDVVIAPSAATEEAKPKKERKEGSE